jgi:hypothetical protein
MERQHSTKVAGLPAAWATRLAKRVKVRTIGGRTPRRVAGSGAAACDACGIIEYVAATTIGFGI